MEEKAVRPLIKDIQKRFFEALDVLIAEKKIDGLQTFCNAYGLHRAKYSNVRASIKEPGNTRPGYRFIDIDALAFLVKDYSVSADWMLMGKGEMFKQSKSNRTQVYYL